MIMQTRWLENALNTLRPVSPGTVEGAEEELAYLKIQAFYRQLSWDKVLELGQVVNEELPPENDAQAGDEWGKHVVDIAINRLRALEEARKAVEAHPESWYRVAVLEFFRRLHESWDL